MNKLIAIAILSLSISGIAQERKEHKRVERENFTPEQQSKLQVKKLTLELDLTAEQQKEIATIINEQQTKREVMKNKIKAQRAENKKLSSDEKFALKNKMLDEKIAHKKRLKKVLTPEQLEKWQKLQKHNMSKRVKRFDKKIQMEK